MKRSVLIALAAGAAVLLAVAWLKMGGGRGGPAAEGLPLPCLLNFRMDGCAPCERTLPAVEAARTGYAGRLRVESIDIARHPGLAGRFRVSAAPTLILFEAAGREVRRHQGAMTREELEGFLAGAPLPAGVQRPAGADSSAEPSLEALVTRLQAAPELKPGPGAGAVPGSGPAGAGGTGVAVYYFHGGVRSGCSQGLEDIAREVISEDCKSVLRGGSLPWHTLNIEAPENAPWVKTFALALNEYDLARGIAVLVKMDGGRPARWKVIGNLADYRMDLDKLREYVHSQAGEFVKAEFR
ncbi:MAG TPA: thioredoxin domain-containing protein [Planctomycetota bacterium]|nr:thioredoxin domain-containing protein [Planctomycetota bacterium]